MDDLGRGARHHLRRVAKDVAIAHAGERVGVGGLPVEGVLDEEAEGDRQLADLGVLEGGEQLMQGLGVAGGGGQAVERLRRELVVGRLARGQDEALDTVDPTGQGDLGVGAAGVVADQRHVLEAERIEGGGNQRPAARGVEIRIRLEADAMGPEREIEDDAIEAVGEQVDDPAPEVGVGQPAVGEDQRPARAATEILDRALWEAELVRLPEQRRAPTVRLVHCSDRPLPGGGLSVIDLTQRDPG